MNWLPTSNKICHENFVNSGGVLCDVAPEDDKIVQKYQERFSFAVYRVARNQNQLNSTNKLNLRGPMQAHTYACPLPPPVKSAMAQ